MDDFAQRFGDKTQLDGSYTYTFSAARQGTIVGMVSIGALLGSLIAGKMSDLIGRRMSISAAAFFTCAGTLIEISSSNHWAQFAIGRLLSGMSIGALSVVVPMYQSECAPAVIRGVIVASYQLLITLGLWTAEIVNWRTHLRQDSSCWRIPNGLTFAWAFILGTAILFFPESPRYDCSRGKVERARVAIAKLSGLPVESEGVTRQITDIQAYLNEESKNAAEFSVTEIFTAPRMLYRTILGIVLQGGQQLTGANYFFYFGTTVFAATGIDDSYVTQIILGTVNVLFTMLALWVTKRFGRRNVLMIGAAWMMMCFL